MANKYGDNVRKIVGIKDAKGGLEAAEEKAKILGQRSTAYIGANGAVNNSTSGKNNGSYSNYSNPSSGYSGSAKQEHVAGSDTEGGIVSGGSGSGGTTGQTQQSDTGATSYEDFMNQAKDPNNPWSTLTFSSPDPLDIVDLTDNNRGPGLNDGTRTDKVAGMIDPATGKEIQILYGVEDYETPFDWLSWDNPPATADPTWQSGFWWDHLSALAEEKYSTPAAAHDDFIEGLNDNNFGNEYEDRGLNQLSPSLYQSCAAQIVSNGNPLPSPGPEFCVEITRVGCAPSDPSGPGDYCSLEAPLTGPEATEWPVDGIISFIAGQSFIASTFESDALGFTQNGAPRLKYNMGGGRTGEVALAADGGTVYYETVGDVPTGTFKKLNMDGELVAAGDVSALDAYLPPTQG